MKANHISRALKNPPLNDADIMAYVRAHGETTADVLAKVFKTRTSNVTARLLPLVKGGFLTRRKRRRAQKAGYFRRFYNVNVYTAVNS